MTPVPQPRLSLPTWRLTIAVIGACVALLLSMLAVVHRDARVSAEQMAARSLSGLADLLQMQIERAEVNQAGHVASRQRRESGRAESSDVPPIGLPVSVSGRLLNGKVEAPLGRSQAFPELFEPQSSDHHALLVAENAAGQPWLLLRRPLAGGRMLELAEPTQVWEGSLDAQARNAWMMGATIVLLGAGLCGIIWLLGRDARRTREWAHQIQENERQLRGVLDKSPVALAMADTETGEVHYANDRMRALLGEMTAPPAVKGDTLLGPLITRQDWQAIRHEMGNALALDNLEFRLAGADDERWGMLSARHVPMGAEFDAMLIGIADISERKAHEMRLANEAMTDMLTGLPNRRYFMNRSLAACEMARRYARPLSVLMIDLDHFKRINDRYGHAMGDKVLHLVAQTIQSSLRQPDVCGRLGGEEFAAMLPEASLTQALEAAERIRQAVAALRFDVPEGDVVQMTVSIGVAQYDPKSVEIEPALEAADRALYRAKAAGRNRVMLARQASTDQTDTTATPA
ncbi:GGDEF domain-containing protein [Burkholderiaceae bacterium DAT-1]|nr:GGDEF domain-containing protein [Burkholderiaceae bacterium DAT-1]